MATVEKQKAAEKGRKRPSEAVEEDGEEDVPPLRRKNRKTKDVGTSEAPAVIPTASLVELLATKVAKKSKV